jgi:hypothetical protein
MKKSRFVLSAAVMLFGSLAAAEDSFPNIDTQKHCRARAQAIGETMGDTQVTSQTLDSCMRSEQQARAALLAAWKDIPQSYKASCVKPNVYSPSYEEWISCLELNMDVKILRSKQ